MEENTNVTGGVATGAQAVTVNGNGQGQAEKGTEPIKTYTAEELRAEADRRVTEALKKANAKAQADFETKMQEAREQWEKESKMTADEREKAAQEKAQKQFEKERAEFKRDKIEFEAAKGLAAEGLPIDFAKMLCGADMDETNANIKAFAQQYNASVQKSVEEQLKGKPPKGGGEPQGTEPFLAGFGK